MMQISMNTATSNPAAAFKHASRASAAYRRLRAGMSSLTVQSALEATETVLLLGAPRPRGNRMSWLQSPKTLLCLAAALGTMFVQGHQELIAGSLWLASGWWLLVPLLVCLLVFNGLQRITTNRPCLLVAPISLPVLRQRPATDARQRDLAQRPRAREAIP